MAAKDHESASLLELLTTALGAVYNPSPIARVAGERGGLEVDANGNLKVAMTADVRVDIDESSLATSAGQITTNASLSSIDTKLTSQATAAKQDTLATAVGVTNTSLASIDTKLTSQATAAKQDTLATAVGVTNTSLSSIDTKATAGNVSTASIDTKLTSQATGAKQDTGNTSVASIDTKIGAAAAATDAADNATTMGVLRARLSVFNGTTWDRLRSAVTTVSATLTGFANTLPWALFHAAPVTRTEGQGGPFETDAKGNLRTSEQAPPAYENVADASVQCHEKPATSAAFNAIPYDLAIKAGAGVIKAAPGNLYRVWFTNTSNVAIGAVLVNKTTSAATSDVVVMVLGIGAYETKLVEFKFGKRFSTGIAWGQTPLANMGGATATVSGTDLCVNAECS